MSAGNTDGARICVRCGRDNTLDTDRCVDCGFDLTSDLQRDYDRYRAQAPARPEPTPARAPAPQAPTRRRKTNPNLRRALKRPTVVGDEETGPVVAGQTPPSLPGQYQQTMDLGSAVLEQVLEEPIRARVATLDLGSRPKAAPRTGSRTRQPTHRPPAPPRPDGGGASTRPAPDEAPAASSVYSGATVAWHPRDPAMEPALPPRPATPTPRPPAAATRPPTPRASRPVSAPLSPPPDLEKTQPTRPRTPSTAPSIRASPPGSADPTLAPLPASDIELVSPARALTDAQTRALRNVEESAWGELEDDRALPPTRGWDGLGGRADASFEDHVPPPAEAAARAAADPHLDAPPTLRGAPGASPTQAREPGLGDPAAGLRDAPATGPARENIRRGTTTYVDATRRGFARRGRGSGAGLWVSVGVGIALGLVALAVYIWFSRTPG